MRIVYTLFLISIFLNSCKKDKLEGSSSALVGKWKWEYSIEYRESNWSMATSHISADDYPEEYLIEFEKKGNIRFLESNTVQEEYRVFFDFLGTPNSVKYDTWFTIFLNNDANLPFSGWNNNDSLVCSALHLPLSNHWDGSVKVTYDHYYSKVK